MVEFQYAAASDQNNRKRFSCFFLILGHYLAAASAWGRGTFAEHSLIVAGDCKGVECHSGIIGSGPEHCGPFSAEAGRIGCIFLIGALDEHSVLQKERRSDLERRIWGI